MEQAVSDLRLLNSATAAPVVLVGEDNPPFEGPAYSSFVQYQLEDPWVHPIFNKLRCLIVFGSCGSSYHLWHF